MRIVLSSAGLLAGLALFAFGAHAAGWFDGGDVGEVVVRASAEPTEPSAVTDGGGGGAGEASTEPPDVGTRRAADRARADEGDPAAPPAPVGVRSARLVDLAPVEEAAAPVHVRIPTIGADLPVDAVGVEPEGDMEIPSDVRRAGWYRYGPVPGAPGSAVITAHVDSRAQGPGPFQRLGELQPGDAVEVDLEDGTSVRFVVIARERVAKADLPLETVFRRDGDPVLTLITCGGDFDPGARRYADNVVVTAAPA